MTKDEALKLALEALEELNNDNELLVSRWQHTLIRSSITAIREALAEQSAKEKAPQSANCEAPGWINSDHARRDDCITEQPYPDNFIDALMYDVAKRDSKAQQAYEDAFVNGTGVLLGGKRIDAASIYKQPVQQQEPEYKGWYCAHCQRGVDGSEVTYHEQHTVCGRVITDDLPPNWDSFFGSTEQPAQQQEPVAWADMDVRGEDKGLSWTPGYFHKTPLYTSPPASKPLTDEEIDKLPWEPHEGNPMTFAEGLRYFARAIEAAHGITGEQHG